ncbi:MAG: ParB N-terminal domain-containing protein [Solobacterium sp.]|nr:ParB N-terminal domain-containing protein [Solobacterium sp.]
MAGMDFTGIIQQNREEVNRRDEEHVGFGTLYSDLRDYTDIKKIDIDKIVANKNNHRSMDSEDIDVLMESIHQKGLLTPLTVWYEESSETYVLASGHRRLAAIKRLIADPEGGWPSNTVNCVVVDKPLSRSEERELLSQANIHRTSAKDKKREIDEARDGWNDMRTEEPDKYNHLKEVYLERFKEEHRGNVTYERDPAKYIHNSFRPVKYYVRALTGVSFSDSTLKRIMKDDDSEEAAPKELTFDEVRIKEGTDLVKKLDNCVKAVEKYFKEYTEESIYEDLLDDARIDDQGLSAYSKEKLIPYLERFASKVKEINALTESQLK